ncbi:MAG: adenylate kinase, partial [Dehalococcoidia bacterium]|nr:adenylate kinase [Dehalococcoidia bacterium]
MPEPQPASSIRPTSARRADTPAAGRRVVVYGPTGSGKTTVSRRIGALLGLPVVELDALYHRPNWQPTPDDEFLATALDTLSRYADGWVCDGNYHAVRPHILPLADTVLWLRPPFLPTYWRLLKRTLGRMRTGEELWNGNRESFRLTFLSRES